MDTYKINIEGLDRELRKFPVNDKLDIAAFILFGDVELDFAGLIVGHDRDVVAVGGFNQIERGPIVGALDGDAE